MAESRKPKKRPSNHRVHSKPPTWDNLKLILSCKHGEENTTTTTTTQKPNKNNNRNKNKCVKAGCSVSFCSIKENPKIMSTPVSTSKCDSKKWVGRRFVKEPLKEINEQVLSSSSTTSVGGGSFRKLHLRRFSGCYECHTAVDPRCGAVRCPSLRSSVCSCDHCGQVFANSENLEMHQALRHAVSELGPGDTSRNIVEIIFQSSWVKKQSPQYKIDRILKVNNTKTTISKFESYRDLIKSRANGLTKKYPRCVADGNELLRFHCTSFTCPIGLDGSTNTCSSNSRCRLCSILRDGFKSDTEGKIQTMATSGRAHDLVDLLPDCDERAMLVCRVIAGRVKKSQDWAEEYDSVSSGLAGFCSNMDRLFVFNPRAILPCFLVIYRLQ